MSLAVYDKGSVSYPTDVYEKYNRYLIKEYEKFYLWLDKSYLGKKELSMSLTLREITELNYLLKENTSDVTKMFNVMNWEDSLLSSYRLINNTLVHNNMEPLVKIETFMRREKLDKIQKAII